MRSSAMAPSIRARRPSLLATFNERLRRALLSADAPHTYPKGVIPAQAGIHLDVAAAEHKSRWIPACAGMTAAVGLFLDQLVQRLGKAVRVRTLGLGQRLEPVGHF